MPFRTIRIFLASSAELCEDRNAFDLYFRQYNDQLRKEMVYLEIVRWENFLDAMAETRLQDEYNKEHGVTPTTVKRAIRDIRGIAMGLGDYAELPMAAEERPAYAPGGRKGKKDKRAGAINEIPTLVANLKKQMHAAAEDLDFEKAAQLRDEIKALEQMELAMR